MKKTAFGLLALLALGGCDVAADMAGDAIAGEVRAQYLAQCSGVAEGAGIAAGNVEAACNCSADKFAKDFAGGELQIDQSRIEGVVKSCVQEQLGTPDAAPAETPNG
jgi:hypothetical protein